MIRTPYHQVSLDTLILEERNPVPQPGGYYFTVLAQGFDLGEAVPVEIVLSSLLQDGELIRKVGHNNRQITLLVTVHGKDDAELSLGEAALTRAINAATELRWMPPSGVGQLTVFDVVTGRKKYQSTDLDMLNNERTFAVTLTCLPFGRTQDPIVQTITTSTPTYGTVDACSTTSGWTLTNPGFDTTLSTTTVGSDAAIRLSSTTYGLAGTLRRTATSLGAATFFALDIKEYGASWGAVATGGAISKLNCVTVGGVDLAPIGTAVSPVSPEYVRYFYMRPANGGSIAFSVFGTFWPAEVILGGIYSATSVPSGAYFVVDVQGTARTPASVAFTKVSNQPAVLYTDRTMLTHNWSPADSTTWSRCPAGIYMLWDGTDGIVSDVSTVTLNDKQTAIARIIGGAIPRPRGAFVLGSQRDGMAGTLGWKKAGGSAMTMTGTRLFRVGDLDDQHGLTSLLRISAVSGTAVKVDVPSRQFPRGGVWVNDIDVTDKCAAWEWPVIGPGPTPLYIEGATDPNPTITHFPRFDTHVAGVA